MFLKSNFGVSSVTVRREVGSGSANTARSSVTRTELS